MRWVLAVLVLAAVQARADAPAPAAQATADAQATANATAPADAPAQAAAAAAPPDGIATVVVSARRLNEARMQIETQTGASTYVIDSNAIAAAPGGENVQLNQVLLQAPSVVQDSFGQLHVRGDHNDLQYRLNGVILPEGISVFGQTLSPRLISSLSLLTGALPAEYGLRTAGVIELTANSGLLAPGGEVSLYGGSHDTFVPAAEYGGSVGSFSYYVSAEYRESNLGIESPDGSSDPLHDHTGQVHSFTYLEKILDEGNRLSFIAGISDQSFEIPNQDGLQPSLGLSVYGQTAYLSNLLNENQRELTEYGILTWQHAGDALNWQSSLSVRYSSLHFAPDWIGDILYNGIAEDAFKADTALGWQTDASYKLGAAHTLRAGSFLQHDRSSTDTASQTLPTDAAGMQTSEVPLVVPQSGAQTQEQQSAYLQDEWQLRANLTLNYGLRFDHYSAYSSGSQTSPRVNFVWQVAPDTVVHGGYSRYYTPPPFELVASPNIAAFVNTTALPPGSVTLDTIPVAQRSNYYDLGIQQKLADNAVTLGVDAFYEQAQHLLDEGQFGAPIILTPFNYRWGLIGGLEFTGSYSTHNFSTYGNLAFQAAHGKGVESSQFNFSQANLDYIADNYIHLDHEGRVTASGGMSYLWRGTRLSADFIFNTGLREAEMLASGAEIPNGAHTPSYTQVNFGLTHEFRPGRGGPLTVRFDVINLFDKVYEIHSGTGIGVFAPQYGPRRSLYGGVSWEF